MGEEGEASEGQELIMRTVFTLLIIIGIIAVMIFWIDSLSSGNIMKKQILAKEVCLLATEAKPGTTIAIEHNIKIIIEKKDSGVVVKEGQADPGYLYPCYLLDNVQFSRKDNVTTIEIK